MPQLKPLDELMQDKADDDAINEAVDAALNAGCERIQSHLEQKYGDFASHYFCSGGPQWLEVRRAFAAYFAAERADMAR